MLKFLVDECISSRVAMLAKSRDLEAFHVNWLNLNGYRDQSIAVYCVAEDLVLITNDASDYKPIYRSLDVHPGLVIVLPSVRWEEQVRLMGPVFDQLAGERDIINKLVAVDADGTIAVSDFPPFRDNL